MDCRPDHSSSNKDFLQEFNRKAQELRIPLSGMFCLTDRCNLRCVHCYLRGQPDAHRDKNELGTDSWISIIDEVADAGCLNLTLTGGEPLIRPDFPEIYCHAKEKGLIVSVFTNGTRISEPVIDVFQDLPPHNIDITLYGATAPTYERITGVPGTFHQCIRGIETLLSHRLPVSLKTVFISLNQDEIWAIKGIADDYGVEFRHDPAISPCLNGDASPLGLRVDPGDVVDFESSNPELRRQWREFYQNKKNFAPSRMLYSCGTGLSSFYIDPYGNLQPCLMVDYLTYDLTSGDFLTGWKDVIPRIREETASDQFECNACEKRVLCGLCPAFFRLESGAEEQKSDYLCNLGEERYRRVIQPAP